MGDGDGFEKRIADLEKRLTDSQAVDATLSAAIDGERLERQESMLWQEHRFLAATRNLYLYRKDPNLRWAAVGGLVSAFFGRSASTALAGGGLIAVVLTAALALQANYLLSLQNERMDVQTVVMDAQRRTQNFQAEFSTIAADVAAQTGSLRPILRSADSRITKVLAEPGWRLSEVARRLAEYSTSKTLPGTPAGAMRVSLYEVANALDRKVMRDDVAFKYGRSLSRIRETVAWVYAKLPEVSSIFPYDEEDRGGFQQFAELIANTEREYEQSLSREQFDIAPGGSGDVETVFYRLDNAVLSRIAGLAASARSYPTLDVYLPISNSESLGSSSSIVSAFLRAVAPTSPPIARLSGQKTSSERGQLLTFLMAQRVSLGDVIQAGADFTGADLSRRVIGPVNFNNGAFDAASFRRSSFFQTIVNGGMRAADFSCASFRGARIGWGDATDANFFGASFDPWEPTTILYSTFAQADFSRANLKGLIIQGPKSELPPDIPDELPLSEFLTRLLPKQIGLDSKYPGILVRSRDRVHWEIFYDKDAPLSVSSCDDI